MSIDKEKPNLNQIFRYLLFIIPLGVIGNLLFSFFKTDRQALASLNAIAYQYLLLAFALSLVPWVTNTCRVWLWTRFLKKPLSVKNAMSIVIATELGSAISPTAIGGGYVKLGMLIQKGFPPGSAASVMVLGSVEDMLFFSIAIPVALWHSKAFHLPVIQKVLAIITGKGTPILWIAGILAFLALSAFLFRYCHFYDKLVQTHVYQKIRTRIKTFLGEFVSVYHIIGKKGKGTFLIAMSLTSIQWICRYSVVSALLACLNIQVHPVLFFLLQWIVFTMGTLMPTPGGAVGIEAAFYLIYSAFIPGHLIGLATASWRFLTYYVLLTLGSIIFIVFNYRGPTGKSNAISPHLV